jgi:hypothetical protein
MGSRAYWLDLFTAKTWQEFLAAGGEVSGFSPRRWRTVQSIKPGDYLLCYLTGVSRWIGVLEVTGEAFKDSSPIWSEWDFSARLPVKVIAALEPDTAVPVLDMKDELSVLQDLKNPNRWSGPFRASPAKWKRPDGEAVVRAVFGARENPVHRPVDPRKLAHRPKALRSSRGAVTVPEDEALAESNGSDQQHDNRTSGSAHTEIQWRLLQLGCDMGFSVWVARNDKGRQWGGKAFADLPRLRTELPHQFDQATNTIIEMIDVLWLQGNAIVAAFEIESTTSIYSGLLRMADLLALQPNLNIPLFLVAPEDRRSKVISEVNRPTFSCLSPPLVDVCRYISFEGLSRQLDQIGPLVRYLKADFLQELSDSCEVEDD